ncbi:hypothetical protein [Modestobacter sp. SSW1-42]|uniref:hypothetical protein n=1 Tax=Modestobacter sp. SSW1-42 TaxID=596372 RepID=UPI003986DA5D
MTRDWQLYARQVQASEAAQRQFWAPIDASIKARISPGSGPRFADELDILSAETFGRITASEAAQERAKLGQRLQESAGTLTGGRVMLTEATAVKPTAMTGRRIRVTIATPGMGASGYYAPAVLEAAARERVFPTGLHMMVDHPSASEQRDRPEGSVRDLAGVLVTDARWTGGALVAEAMLLPNHADLLASMAGVIGVSLRASGDIEMGEVGGEYVRKITRLVPPATSVDFVTKAGRGGFFEVLESERPRWGG